MKLSFLIPLVMLMAFTSCDNDLEITDTWSDVTIVYGLLDPLADTNYVRIERGYLGTEPAANSFDEPDSFFYDNLSVELNWYNDNDILVSSVQLIEDNTTRELNDNGPFSVQDAYRIYRVPTGTPISTDFEYELIITKANEQITSARTEIIEADGFVFLGDFVTIPPLQQPLMRSGNMKFKNRASNAAYYEGYMSFYWQETDQITKVVTDHSIRFKYGSQEATISEEYNIGPAGGVDAMFGLIANRIPIKQNVLRKFSKIKVEVLGADEDLYTYATLNTPSTSINQNRPTFSNITNGEGIFSSRFTYVLDDILLNDAGNPLSLNDRLLLTESMCPLRFIRLQGIDTCICKDVGDFLTIECL